MTDFLPSEHGLSFANDFPPQPLLTVHLPILGTVDVGDASRGLCGGMTFTALDYFLAGRLPPRLAAVPEHDSPLNQYIRRRQIDSVGSLKALFRCYLWTIRQHGLVERTRKQLPLLLEQLARRPVPLMLIRACSWRPDDAGNNHQALAHAARFDGDSVVLSIYDPDLPDDDDVRIVIGPDKIEHSRYPVRGLYVSDYIAREPPR